MSTEPAPLAPFVAIALWIACCAGCASGGLDAPRDRLGALPFPGPMSLYTTADPAHLGRHRYGRCPRLVGEDEKERGILYTTRAGFLDLAHVRIAIDWTRYCTWRVREALERGRGEAAIEGPDKGVFYVDLRYPEGWDQCSAPEREALVDAASRRIGGRVTYQILTWHEIATWFGYRSFFFDETRSAFTYDDTVATLVGMRVADRVLGEGSRDFESAVTAELDEELARLGAVGPGETERAVRAVEGVWWAGDAPLKRQADVYPGEETVVRPWLVNGLAFGAGAKAEVFALPCAEAGEAIAASVEVDPRIPEAERMRALLPGRPGRFGEDRELPALMSAMREQMREQYGPAVCRPWPDTAGPGRIESAQGTELRERPAAFRSDRSGLTVE
jgi:hypothetical protein